MIRVEGLKKSFEGFAALDGCTLHAEKGGIYGLVGPNGAGKSTLIRHLTGAYRQDAGTVTIDNQPVYENPALKARIGVIPDDVYYFAQASTRDMRSFYRGIYPSFSMERYEKLRDAFSAIDDRQPIRRLSKGMQKQAAFWLMLCCMPDVVLLDEPVDGLDPVMRRQVWSLLMSDVAERGVTVMVSSHNLRELEDVCDHVGIMNKGRIMVEQSLTELQGGITKVQVVFENGLPDIPELEIIHASQRGRIHTLIIRGGADKVCDILETYTPLLVDALPLTLEEIFVYELGGEDYGVREIIL